MSGISPSDECLAAYNVVKTGKASFGVFTIKDEKTVECDFSSEKYAGNTADFQSTQWSLVKAYVEENLGAVAAYIVSEFKYMTDDGREANKMVLISWCPENKLKVKAKMLHGSTLNAIKQCFEGLQQKPIQAATFADVEYDNIYEETK